jgi:hypothetical protein
MSTSSNVASDKAFRTLPKSSDAFGNPQMGLLIESVHDALGDAVRALGGPKVVASMMWPTKSIDAGRKKLLDMLSPDRDEKFSPEQVIWLLRQARQAGYHNAMQWVCGETGYECKPLDPEVERDRLADAIEQASANLGALLKAAERAANRGNP